MTALAPPTVATMPAFLARVRHRAERRVQWMRHLWGAYADTRALAISDDDVDQILTDPAAMAAREAAFYRTNTPELTEAIERLDILAGDERSLARLRDAFTLTQSEVDFLTLCIAVEADPMLRRVFGYLHDDATLAQPTPWLAAALFGSALERPAQLAKWKLAQPLEGHAPHGVMTPWSADPFVTAFVLEGEWHDPAIATAIEFAAAPPLVLHPELLDDAERFVRTMLPHAGAPIELELVAPEGSGRRALAAQLAARLGKRLVAVDLAVLQQSADAIDLPNRLFRVARLARAAEAVPYWSGGASLPRQAWRAVCGVCDVMLFAGETPSPRTNDTAPRKTILLPSLDTSARRALWSSLTDAPMPDEAGQWLLTPSELAGAAAVAPAGREELTAACRALVHRAPGELFSPLPLPYTWDDIVLTGSVHAHLREVEQQARLRDAVLDDWGFARVHPNRGLSALFAGPSGTGKTMAAQVLARALGLDLYRVDLSGVINKYVGETEKRLKLVFDACERANVLLFFDEADALFGNRTRVRDAHDRFANIEIDYLLQRMEEFRGIAVLASNRRSDLDKAFVRRLRFIIEFMTPGPAERLALWRRALPERSPADEPLLDGVDFARLAEGVTASGADIKSAAVAAAFLARAEGTRIGMRHILAALRRELAKQNIELRAGDLGGLV